MTSTAMFLPPNEPGYFGVGFDPWQSDDVPIWVCTENLSLGTKSDFASLASQAAQWVLEGVEFESKRWVDIYFVDDTGKLDSEFAIRIGVK
jgi:hypothetical protein